MRLGLGMGLGVGGPRPWSIADLPGLWYWGDSTDAVIDGADVTSWPGRAGLYPDALALDPGDNGVEPTIGDVADALGGARPIVLASQTNLYNDAAPAVGSGAFSVTLVIRSISFAGVAQTLDLLAVGRRYFLADDNFRGGIGQVGAAGVITGGGVSAGTVVHTLPISTIALSLRYPQVVTVEHDGTDTRIYVNGVLAGGPQALTRDIGSPGITLGRAGGGTGAIDGEHWVFDAVVLGRVLSSVERGRMVKDRLRARRVTPARALGDSNTEGSGLASPSTEAWPIVLAAELFSGFGSTLAIENMGLSGRTSEDVYLAIDDDVTDHYIPDAPVFLVILSFGTNDIGEGVSLATFQANVGDIVTDLRALGSNVRIVMTTIAARDWPDPGTQEPKRLAFNAWIKTAGALGPQVDLVFDLAAMPEASDAENDTYFQNAAPWSAPFGIHYTDVLHAEIGAEMAAAIDAARLVP